MQFALLIHNVMLHSNHLTTSQSCCAYDVANRSTLRRKFLFYLILIFTISLAHLLVPIFADLVQLACALDLVRYTFHGANGALMICVNAGRID